MKILKMSLVLAALGLSSVAAALECGPSPLAKLLQASREVKLQEMNAQDTFLKSSVREEVIAALNQKYETIVESCKDGACSVFIEGSEGISSSSEFTFRISEDGSILSPVKVLRSL